jgi:hypothetical protein
MARKRASLKDKGAETLGLTPKKGQGIDVLFGGPPIPQNEGLLAGSQTATTAANDEPVDDMNDLSGLLENPTPAVPAFAPAPVIPSVADSLPVNEADDDEADVITFEGLGDDLGLPVALDGPPLDLELATPTAEELPAPLPEMPAAAEVPPAMSLDSLPAAQPVTVSPPPEALLPAAEAVPIPAPESLAPAAEPAPMPPESLAPAAEPATASPAITPSMPADEADDYDDLSGLKTLNENEVAGMGTDDDLTSLPDDAIEPPREQSRYVPTNLPPGSPPVAAIPRPATVVATPAAEPLQPPVPQPAPMPSPVTPAQPASPRPMLGTPPSTATGAPSLSMPRAKIESVEGFVTSNIQVREEDILPEDNKMLGEADNIIGLKDKEEIDHDEMIARKVTRYVGAERRQKLDEEIERLYGEVAEELSVNKEDSEFALKVLSQAQDIIFEDTRQYDEAFYLVSIVRTMIARKRNLRRWTYTWGTFVFIYALVWLGFFIAGYLLYDQIGTQIGNTSDNVDAIRAAWFAALAGGIGGVIGILYSLYWHVAMKQDFDRQYVMYYLVQPVMGFVLGAVVYFIIGSGFLIINFALPDSSDPGAVLSSPTIIAIQVVLGWAAGFRQRFVFEMVDKIVQRISPKDDDDEAKKPESLVAEEERQRIQARINEKAKNTPAISPDKGNTPTPSEPTTT